MLAPSLRALLVPKTTALTRLQQYLHDYNTDRSHTGRLTQGRVPADIVYGARKTTPDDDHLSPHPGLGL